MDNIKKLREERNISAETLAKGIDVSCRTVFNWESGRTEPGAEAIKRLASFFGVSTDVVLGVK